MLRTDSAASSGGQGMQTYFMYFPWLLLEERLSISAFCFLFTRVRDILFLMCRLFMTHWSLKDITQYQVLVSTIFNCLLRLQCCNFFFLIKYFAVSTCKLFAWVQIVKLKTAVCKGWTIVISRKRCIVQRPVRCLRKRWEDCANDERYKLQVLKLKGREVCWLVAQHKGYFQLHWNVTSLDYIKWHFRSWLHFHIQANTNSAYSDILPRIRMSTAIPLLPLHAIMVWTGTTLPFSITFTYSDVLFIQRLTGYCGVSSYN
jgi:hypothetical protein